MNHSSENVTFLISVDSINQLMPKIRDRILDSNSKLNNLFTKA